MIVAKRAEERKHPHADAVYDVFQQSDMTFAVRVSIPDVSPTTITSFASDAAARGWIDDYKAKAERRAGLKPPRAFASYR